MFVYDINFHVVRLRKIRNSKKKKLLEDIHADTRNKGKGNKKLHDGIIVVRTS